MGINWLALEAIQNRQERAFHPPNRPPNDFVSRQYVPGEEWWREGFSLHPLEIMIIGEAPGAREDALKRPFVGESGIMLRRLMEGAELPHSWITNVVKFRPHRNATPTDEMIELAKPYLIREWNAIGKPRVIVCLGNVPLKAVTGEGKVLSRAGVLEVYPASDGKPCYVMPMVHPSFAIRNPGIQEAVEGHWQNLRAWLDVAYKG